MKKVMALVLVCIFLLGGCGNTGTLDLDQTGTVEEDSLILVRSMDGSSKPYENFLWAEKWSEYGWISGNGTSISRNFTEIHEELPQITYGDDFEIYYRDGVEFLSLSVYNSAFDRIYHNAGQEGLKDLAEGTYYLVITVKSQGQYM